MKPEREQAAVQLLRKRTIYYRGLVIHLFRTGSTRKLHHQENGAGRSCRANTVWTRVDDASSRDLTAGTKKGSGDVSYQEAIQGLNQRNRVGQFAFAKRLREVARRHL